MSETKRSSAQPTLEHLRNDIGGDLDCHADPDCKFDQILSQEHLSGQATILNEMTSQRDSDMMMGGYTSYKGLGSKLEWKRAQSAGFAGIRMISRAN
jgi:hypothetical protein